jgi:uncharacterized membrane protein YfcA
MTPEELILTALIFIAATLYSSVGHAGASGYLAAMALFGLAPETMRPTALALNVLVASLATYRYTRAGQNDLKLLIPFVVASIPAAFVGGMIHIPPAFYKPLIGIILLLSAFQLLRTAKTSKQKDRKVQRPPLAASLATGAGLGLLAGLSGTGGGIFLSPLLLFMGWAPTRNVSGVAASFILVNSISGLAWEYIFASGFAISTSGVGRRSAAWWTCRHTAWHTHSYHPRHPHHAGAGIGDSGWEDASGIKSPARRRGLKLIQKTLSADLRRMSPPSFLPTAHNRLVAYHHVIQRMLVKCVNKNLACICQKMLQLTGADDRACVGCTVEAFHQIHVRLQCENKIA